MIRILNEAYPSILKGMPGASELARSITSAGVDFTSDDYTIANITSNRDPRLKDPNTIVLIKFDQTGKFNGQEVNEPAVVAFQGGKSLSHSNIWLRGYINGYNANNTKYDKYGGRRDQGTNVNDLSWTKILSMASEIQVIVVNPDSASKISQLQNDRRDSQRGRLVRKRPEDMGYWDKESHDKSGYYVNKEKYKMMLSKIHTKRKIVSYESKVNDAAKLVDEIADLIPQIVRSSRNSDYKGLSYEDAKNYLDQYISLFDRIASEYESFRESPSEWKEEYLNRTLLRLEELNDKVKDLI